MGAQTVDGMNERVNMICAQSHYPYLKQGERRYSDIIGVTFKLVLEGMSRSFPDECKTSFVFN